MNYPVWEPATGGGVLVAIVSILHVFVSHFAVGGGLWLVVNESLARRQADDGRLELVRKHSRFFLLVTLVLGAITGVGIWFTIALVSPTAVSTLIHAYLWGWAMEWIFFVVEIAAAIVYWYGWSRLDARTHQTVGWIYFVAAWASLAIINGIVTFMLTPGAWLQDHSFWTGFFNPTYFPSLAMRTSLAFGQAGLFALATAAFVPHSALRRRITRESAIWILAAVAVGALAGLWYRASIPGWSDALLGAIPVLPTMARALVLGAVALALLALWPLLWPARWRAFGILPLTAAALVVFAAGEWVREAGRKPFAIAGYLYSTGLLVENEPTIAAEGLVAHTRWLDPRAISSGDPVRLGGELFRNHCAPCHAATGYNALGPWLARCDDATVAGIVPRLGSLRGLMPVWHGTPDESAALTAWLCSRRPAAARKDGSPRSARRAWDVACGLCHTTDGYRALRGSLAGQSREELSELIDTIQELTDEMPPYSAEPEQRSDLLDYLTALAAPTATPAAATKGVTP